MEHRVKVTVLDNGISRAVQSYFFDMTNRNLCFLLTEASKREILAYGNRTDGRQKRAGRIRPGENGSNEWMEPVTDEVYGL